MKELDTFSDAEVMTRLKDIIHRESAPVAPAIWAPRDPSEPCALHAPCPRCDSDARMALSLRGIGGQQVGVVACPFCGDDGGMLIPTISDRVVAHAGVARPGYGFFLDPRDARRQEADEATADLDDEFAHGVLLHALERFAPLDAADLLRREGRFGGGLWPLEEDVYAHPIFESWPGQRTWRVFAILPVEKLRLAVSDGCTEFVALTSPDGSGIWLTT